MSKQQMVAPPPRAKTPPAKARRIDVPIIVFFVETLSLRFNHKRTTVRIKTGLQIAKLASSELPCNPPKNPAPALPANMVAIKIKIISPAYMLPNNRNPIEKG